MSTRSRQSNEVAISVIIGTLLLILITVTAASALALFLSQMQKDAMNRQSHLADVQSELLTIRSVNLTKQNVTDANWDHANITILNLNTKDSRLMSVSMNGVWAAVMNVYDTSGNPDPSNPYNVSEQHNYIDIPATQARVISLNLSGPYNDLAYIKNISTGDSIAVLVMTSNINTFGRTFQPPVPVMKITTDTQDLGVAQKTLIVFDGSESYSPNGSIVNYTWNIFDTTNISNPNPYQVYGSISKQEMQSSGPFIVNLSVTDDSGLSTISQNTTIGKNPGFNPPTHIYILPFYTAISLNSSNIDINGVSTPPYNQEIDAYVYDSNNEPLSNQIVTFSLNQEEKNLTLTNWSGVTGMNSIPAITWVGNISGAMSPTGGVVTVSSGKLPPQNIQVSFGP